MNRASRLRRSKPSISHENTQPSLAEPFTSLTAPPGSAPNAAPLSPAPEGLNGSPGYEFGQISINPPGQAPEAGTSHLEPGPRIQRQTQIEVEGSTASHPMGPEGGAIDATVRDRIDGARGGGAPLDSAVRTEMEPLFQHDFGKVRIFADAESDTLNRQFGATAFTTGSDIFFRPGAYNPASQQGRELLAHELTHVVQQSPASNGVPEVVTSATDPSERAANVAARQVANGRESAAVDSAITTDVATPTSAGIQRAPATVVDMPAETIINLGPGKTPTQAIDNGIDRMKMDVNLYWGSYRDALQAFTNRMSFSSEQEAESHYLDSAFKGLAKGAFDLALDALAEVTEIPEVKLIKEVVMSVYEEHERVEKAEGEVKIVKFINDELLEIQPRTVGMMDAVEKQRRPLTFAYSKAAGAEQPDAMGSISGPGAEIISALDKAAKAFHQKIQTATPAMFQEVLTERFAGMGGQYVGPLTQGVYENAHIYLNARVKHDGDSWTIDTIDDAWELRTNAPKAANVAASLKESLEKQGGLKPYESFLPKVVRFTVQTGSWVITSDYDDGAVSFTAIDSPSFDVTDALLHGRDPNMFRIAWETVLKKKVMEISELRGSGG